jgi:hypothetical protein
VGDNLPALQIDSLPELKKTLKACDDKIERAVQSEIQAQRQKILGRAEAAVISATRDALKNFAGPATPARRARWRWWPWSRRRMTKASRMLVSDV